MKNSPYAEGNTNHSRGDNQNRSASVMGFLDKHKKGLGPYGAQLASTADHVDGSPFARDYSRKFIEFTPNKS